MKTVTLDSNVILRFLVGDVPEQYEQASKALVLVQSEKLQAWISLLVFNEIAWILEHYYKLSRADFVPKLRELFSLKGIEFIELKKDVIMQVLGKMEETNFDVTDIYLSLIADKKDLVTFDKDFEKLYKRKR
jgi:predicted nucleic acid-binding protein